MEERHRGRLGCRRDPDQPLGFLRAGFREVEVFFAGVDFPEAVDFPVFFPVFFPGFLPVASDFPDSRRCRRTASTRLPTPRPSRASCVGVDVDPEIFFSEPFVGPSVDDAFDALPLPESPSPDGEVPSPSFELDVVEPADAWFDSSAGVEDDPPPTSTAAPMPIRRRSFLLPHSGHFFSGAAVIDWKSSKRWSQASQT